ncbi:MAG: sugar phosphate nucleotidyltransferase, partial [Planctomycetota bacterium]
MAKVRKAVIPLAGRATRQFPASLAVPKGLFPLVDRDGLTKPIVQILAEEALDSGIEELCLVTGPGEERVYREYFRRPQPDLLRTVADRRAATRMAETLATIGARLHFAEQTTPEGFGHAVYQARAFAANEPFLLLLGDHVFISATAERCARQVLRVFEGHDLAAVTGVQLTPESLLGMFGTIRGASVDAGGGAGATGNTLRGVYRAELIVEKPSVDLARAQLATPGLPAGQYLSHFGLHVFGPQMFDVLERHIRDNVRHGGEVQLTPAEERLRAETGRYWVVLVQGRRCDAG